MKQKLLQWLRCPVCHGTLRTSVYEPGTTGDAISAGLLSCSCKTMFPVWRGVPRMLLPGSRSLPKEFLRTFQDQLAKEAPELLREGSLPAPRNKYSFDVQWSIYKYDELTWELDLSTRVNYVYQYLRMEPGSLNGAIVFDAGCGNGTLTAGLAKSGPEVIGLDYSQSVEWAEREKKRFAGAAAERVHYVQGDVQNPPFAPGSFDVIYSDGVLHHTPNTEKSFRAIAPLAKEGGRFFVWLYGSEMGPAGRIKMAVVKKIQVLMRPLPFGVAKGLCFAGAAILLTQLRIQHLLGISKRRIIPLRLKAVNLFDTFTPRYYHLQTLAQVMGWFKDCGFLNPVETTIPSLGPGGLGILGIHDKQAERIPVRAASFRTM